MRPRSRASQVTGTFLVGAYAEEGRLEPVKILSQLEPITSDYDEDADVLYLSIGEPRPALGIDVGDGLVVRYDEANREVVGLTVIGLRERLRRGLDGN